MKEENYLKKELYNLVRTDSSIFDFLQEGCLDGMWYWDLEHPEQEWMNDKFWEVIGYDPDTKEHLSSEWQDIINQDDLKLALDNFQKHCKDPNYPYDQIVRYKHLDGRIVWVRCRGIAIRDENGTPVRMLGAHMNLTKEKELQLELEEKNQNLKESHEKILKLNQQLNDLVIHDFLTGLYNRHFLDELVLVEKEKADRHKMPFSICMMDINNFKYINDTYGHLAGDQVLIDFGKKLNELLRKQDIKCRWGGDEFLVLLPETDMESAVNVIDKMTNKMECWSIEYQNKHIPYCITAGVSEYRSGEFIDDCINRADMELYKHKKKSNK